MMEYYIQASKVYFFLEKLINFVNYTLLMAIFKFAANIFFL